MEKMLAQTPQALIEAEMSEVLHARARYDALAKP